MDVVFTWVDDSEPDFKAELTRFRDLQEPERVSTRWRARSKYTGQFEQRERDMLGAGTGASSVDESRFRNSGELRYALRSLEAHAPFVDRIFIITNGQRPSWIDENHPKLRFVTHREMFPDPSVLPSFNSSAIETNLHRISDLSDDFIYMNDDFFFGRPVTLEDFRTKEGMYRLFVEGSAPLPKAMDDRSLIGHCWAFNHNLIIDRLGPPEKARMFAHTPQMYNRWLLQEVELVWREQVQNTRANRFRSPFDAHMRLLYTYYVGNPKQKLRALGDKTGAARLTNLSDADYAFVRFGDERAEYMSDLGRIMRVRPKFFCINDEFIARNEAESAIASSVIEGFLQSYFPTPSSFEKELPAALTFQDSDIPLPNIEGVHFKSVVFPPKSKPVIWHKAADERHFRQHTAGHLDDPSVMIRTGNHVRILEQSAPESFEFFLTMYCPEDVERPLAGFSQDRTIRVNVPHAAGETFEAREWVDEYLNRQRIIDALTHSMAPMTGRLKNDTMAAFLKADRAIRAGQKDISVIHLLEQALTGGVDAFWVMHRLVLVYLARGEHYPKALDTIRQALKRNPKGLGIFQDLAENLAGRGMYGEALPTADGILLEDPQDLRAGYVRSLCRYQFNAEDPEVSKLIRDTSSPKHIALWSRVMRRQNQPAHVILPVLNKAIKAGQKTFDILLATAMAHDQSGNRPQTLMKVAEAMSTGVSGAVAIAAAADAEREAYPSVARLVLDAVRARMPWETAAIAPHIRLRIAEGDTGPDVAAELDELIAKGQDVAEARVAKARLLFALEKDQEALEELKSAGDKADFEQIMAIAEDANVAGKANTALEIMRTLCEIQPGSPISHRRVVELLIDAGSPVAEIESAIVAAKAAGAAEDWALLALARAHADAGDTKALARLVKDNAANAETLLLFDQIADDLASADKPLAALAIIKALAQAQPSSEEARLRWVTLAINNDLIDDKVRAALKSLPVDDLISPAHVQKFRVDLADGNSMGAALALRSIDQAGMDAEPYLIELDRYHGLSIYDEVMRQRSGLDPEDYGNSGT